MSGHGITRFVETGVTRQRERHARIPSSVYPGWRTWASQRSARAVAVGRRVVWVATWGGVLAWNRRADDAPCDRYGSEHGLPGSAVACLCLDATGRPWAATDEGGLAWFDTGRWHALGGWQAGVVRALTTAAGEGVWAATADAIYYVAGPDQLPRPIAKGQDGARLVATLLSDGEGVLAGGADGLFRLLPGRPPARVEAGRLPSCTALARDGDGGLWASAPRTVYRLDDGKDAFPIDGVPTPTRVIGLASGLGGVWALTTTGPGRLNEGHWQDLALPVGARGQSLPVRAIAARTEETFLWAGTDERLAVGWPEHEGFAWDADLLPSHADDGLNNVGRCAVAAPASDGPFVGTAGGLLRFNASGEWARVASGDVRALCIAGGTIFFLSRPHGVGAMNESGATAPLSRQPPGFPLTLGVGKDGAAYAMTTRGLFCLGGGEPRAVAEGLDLAVRCLVQAHAGPWWLGTERGVFRLGPAGWELAGEQPGPRQEPVHALTVSGGELFAATDSGLWQRLAAGWLHRRSGPVWALASAALPGALWIAGPAGIARLVNGEASPTWTPANSGLSAQSAVALVEQGGALWVVTGGGVSRLLLP